MEELRTLVIYDIVEDRIRTRIADTCLDFGLIRIQYSAFAGLLNRNKREELFLRLCDRQSDLICAIQKHRDVGDRRPSRLHD